MATEVEEERRRYEEACKEIARLALSKRAEELNLNRLKKEVSRKYGLSSIPKNADVLNIGISMLRGEKGAGSSGVAVASVAEELRERLRRKPMRTASGVAPVAVMTSPHPCPHGRCVMCPGGPYSEFKSPQSYVGREPAAARASQHHFDPYEQVLARLRQLEEIGHDYDKVELILMGGTLTARSEAYQRWFVKRCLDALNDFGAARKRAVRNIGITFETRPDYAREPQIDLMLELGATKVEIGVQHVRDEILQKIKRGHTVADTIVANQKLRDAALKVGFHVMLGLPGSSVETDKEMFEQIFNDERFKPDFLKIYPTLVVKGTELYEMWKRGEYEPLDVEDAVEIIAYAKKIVPRWVRIQRIQRDIPAKFIEAGVKKSNLRQLVHERLAKEGRKCMCVRCREAGLRALRGEMPDAENVRLCCESYEACGGTEFFLSYEDTANDILVALLRLRLPCEPHRAELKGAALVRELHVYGELVPLGERKERSWQHRGYGAKLLAKAEEIASAEGCKKVAIMSGIGVREYYKRFGYVQEGPYMVKKL